MMIKEMTMLLLLASIAGCDSSDSKRRVETGATVLENQFGQFAGDAFLDLIIGDEWKMKLNVVLIGRQGFSLSFSAETWAHFLNGSEMQQGYPLLGSMFSDGSVRVPEDAVDPRIVGYRLAQRSPMIVELALYEGPMTEGQVSTATARLVGAFGAVGCNDETVGGTTVTTACLDGFQEAELDDFNLRLVPAIVERTPQEH